YDRLIEDYLHRYFTRMGKWNNAMMKFLNDNIIHVYGSLGKLSWQDKEKFAVYAHDNNEARNMENTMNNFELMFEGSNAKEMEEQKGKARTWLQNANQIYSLGFGYYCENLKYLQIPFDKPIKSTGIGFKEERKNQIKRDFNNLEFLLCNMTCAEFVESEGFVI
ncbi:MAG: hypothetical protein ABII90_15420, partial [Bacteroidota bacterium]